MKYCKNYQNVTQRNKVNKCCRKNDADRHKVATNLLSVKITVSARPNTLKYNKMRYAFNQKVQKNINHPLFLAKPDTRLATHRHWIQTIYLPCFFFFCLAALGLHCCVQAFSSYSDWGASLCCGAQTSHCGGFSCCRAQD